MHSIQVAVLVGILLAVLVGAYSVTTAETAPPSTKLKDIWARTIEVCPDLRDRWGTEFPVDDQGNINMDALTDLSSATRYGEISKACGLPREKEGLRGGSNKLGSVFEKFANVFRSFASNRPFSTKSKLTDEVSGNVVKSAAKGDSETRLRELERIVGQLQVSVKNLESATTRRSEPYDPNSLSNQVSRLQTQVSRLESAIGSDGFGFGSSSLERRLGSLERQVSRLQSSSGGSGWGF